MRHVCFGVTLAVAIVAAVSPLRAQAPLPPTGAPPAWPWPQAASAAAYQRYPFSAPTPDDAYRDHQINRWELEQITGPLPQALQGPSPNGMAAGRGGN